MAKQYTKTFNLGPRLARDECVSETVLQDVLTRVNGLVHEVDGRTGDRIIKAETEQAEKQVRSLLAKAGCHYNVR